MFARRRAGARQDVSSWGIDAPPQWGPMPTDAEPRDQVLQVMHETAARLTTDAEAAERCAELMVAAQPGYVDQGLIGLAAWVPDPVAGIPQGVLLVDVWAADGSTPADLAARAAVASLPEGTVVVDRSITETTLAAGPAVAITATGHDAGGSTELIAHWVVFPPGCLVVFSLRFSTGALHLAEEFLEQAALIAASLSVELEA